jgi:hypothetical protein
MGEIEIAAFLRRNNRRSFFLQGNSRRRKPAVWAVAILNRQFLLAGYGLDFPNMALGGMAFPAVFARLPHGTGA